MYFDRYHFVSGFILFYSYYPVYAEVDFFSFVILLISVHLTLFVVTLTLFVVTLVLYSVFLSLNLVFNFYL